MQRIVRNSGREENSNFAMRSITKRDPIAVRDDRHREA